MGMTTAATTSENEWREHSEKLFKWLQESRDNHMRHMNLSVKIKQRILDLGIKDKDLEFLLRGVFIPPGEKYAGK